MEPVESLAGSQIWCVQSDLRRYRSADSLRAQVCGIGNADLAGHLLYLYPVLCGNESAKRRSFNPSVCIAVTTLRSMVRHGVVCPGLPREFSGF